MFHLVWENAYNLGGLVVCILDYSQPEGDLCVLQDFASAFLQNPVVAVPSEETMDQRSPFTLTEPDQHHLVKTAFDFGFEICVWFNSSKDSDVICSGGNFVKINWVAEQFANLDHLHRRSNWHTHTLFCNSYMFEDFNLSLSCGSSMASHSGNYVGCTAYLLEFVDDRFRDYIDIGNAATSNSDGDSISNLDS